MQEPIYKIVVKTLQGLEVVLADELKALGATDVHPVKRAVECRGNRELIYRANYEARTALRVLVHLHSGKIFNERDLYRQAQSIPWHQLMEVGDTLAVEATIAGQVIRHSQYAALVTKDAVVDQFRERYNRRPNVNTTAPTLRIHVRVHGTQCDFLLDSSGDSLHKRGYRRDSVEAPLNEVLAAGMLLLAGWDQNSALADAMCGSGTLPIEAAFMALHQSPQYYRETPFGFTKWKNFDAECWKKVKNRADEQRLTSLPFPIWGTDMNPRAVNAARINAMAAGLEKIVHFEKQEFEVLQPPASSGTLIMNPPYDERLPLYEAEAFYQRIGDTLKKNWPGWTAWVISSNKEALKRLGLRASRRIELINGSLECSFQKFDLYAGSKYPKKEEANPEAETDTPT